ncbi:MAG: hypothetical protein Q8O43_04060 [Dehalococcoidia bacterium]|nr:hypothetical protein [Dehalococcoidia bacterium]
MRTLSSTLLASQKSASRIPYVKVTATNKLVGVVRLKWERLYTGTEPDGYHAVTVPGDGSLVRVRVGPGEDSNKLYRQRVTSPGPQSDFSQWTYTNQYNCQAVAVASRSAEVIIFWVNVNHELVRLLSSDYGASWGTADVIDLSTSSLVPGISAAYKPNGDIAVFFASGTNLYVKKRVGGSWQGKSAWDKTTGVLSSVAAVYDGDWNLIVTGQDTSGNYRVWSLVYGDGGAVPAGDWSALKALASAASGGDFEYRAVYMDKPDFYRAFYVEKFTGTQSYNRPFRVHNVPETGFLNGLWCEPVPFNLSSEFGIAMAHYGSYAWLSTPSGVWRSNLQAESLDVTADVTGARQESQPTGGKLTVELRNENGKHNAPGTGSLAVLVTGCQLEFSPGYRTTQGNEFSAAPAFWLEAYEHTSAGGIANLVLYGIDGWGLLSEWRAQHQFRWNRTGDEMSVKQMLEFVLARVGLKLEVKSESAVVTGFYPDFTIHPGDSGLAIISRLLSFVPDVVFIEGLKASLVNPQSSDTSVYSYGTAHVIFSAGYRTGVPELNQVTVAGEDPAAGTPVIANTFSWTQIEKFPERWRPVFDKNVGTVAEAEDRGSALLRDAEIAATGGMVRVPVNCGQQMYDVIDITDNRAGLSAAKRRVVGISLSYRPDRGEYVQQLLLGGV